MMEVFAGFLSHTDHQIGRLVDVPRADRRARQHARAASPTTARAPRAARIGSLNEHRFTHDMLDDLADTLARIDELGGFRAYNHYAWGWAWAGNTPLRLWKRYSWLGGVRTPLDRALARRRSPTPARCATQFCHAVDSAADGARRRRHRRARRRRRRRRSSRSTGVSLRADVRRRRRPTPHDTQYFEMLGIARDLPRRLEGHDRPRRPADSSIERELHRGQPRLRRRPLVALRPRRRLLRVDRPRPTQPGQRSQRAAGPVVERGRAQPGAAARRQLHRSGRARMEPPTVRPRAPHRLHAGRRRVAEDRPSADGRRLRRRRRASTSRRAPTAILFALGDWRTAARSSYVTAVSCTCSTCSATCT